MYIFVFQIAKMNCIIQKGKAITFLRTTRSNDWKYTAKTKITKYSKVQIIPTRNDLNIE